MTARRSPRVLGAVVTAALLAVVGAGCSVGTADDETTPAPRRTVVVTPSQQASPQPAVPTSVPPAHGGVGPGDVVWVQGSVLHVGSDAWDLAPRSVDSFVVVRGGVYFIDGGGLWFTDTVTVKDTGVVGATGLSTDAAGTGLLVAGAGRTRAFDVRTGARVAPRTVEAATIEQRLGRPVTIRLRPERSDLTSGGPVTARLGPGTYGVVDSESEPAAAFVAATRQTVPLRGASGSGFELVRWTGPSTFYGLVLRQDRPYAVLGCDVAAGSCRTWGRVDGAGSLLFGSGS